MKPSLGLPQTSGCLIQGETDCGSILEIKKIQNVSLSCQQLICGCFVIVNRSCVGGKGQTLGKIFYRLKILISAATLRKYCIFFFFFFAAVITSAVCVNTTFFF